MVAAVSVESFFALGGACSSVVQPLLVKESKKDDALVTLLSVCWQSTDADHTLLPVFGELSDATSITTTACHALNRLTLLRRRLHHSTRAATRHAFLHHHNLWHLFCRNNCFASSAEHNACCFWFIPKKPSSQDSLVCSTSSGHLLITK